MNVPHGPRPMPWTLLCQGDNLATAARVTPRACRGHPEPPARRKPAKYMTSAFLYPWHENCVCPASASDVRII